MGPIPEGFSHGDIRQFVSGMELRGSEAKQKAVTMGWKPDLSLVHFHEAVNLKRGLLDSKSAS